VAIPAEVLMVGLVEVALVAAVGMLQVVAVVAEEAIKAVEYLVAVSLVVG